MTTTLETTRPLPPGTPVSWLQQWALMSALNPSRVSKREGMSYLEAWDVKASLIKVWGFGGFSSELLESEILDVREVPQRANASKMNQKVTAKAVVRLTIHQTGAVYTEAAIAGSSQPDITESMDMAIKSAESDALKRCAIFLGTQFGLSLYQNGATHDIVQKVLAPDQLWPRPNPDQPVAPQEEPSTPAPGVTSEQHEANKALVQRGLNMKAKARGPEEPQEAVAVEPDYSAEVAEYEAKQADVPMALDPTLR
jgi:recombination DNA repair RAD52 pathway protein